MNAKLSGSWSLDLCLYSSGVSTSSLSDGILVIHVSPEDHKQKVRDGPQCPCHATELPALQPQYGRVLSSGATATRTAVSSPRQGDAILQCQHIFEAVTKLVMLVKRGNIVNVVQGR